MYLVYLRIWFFRKILIILDVFGVFNVFMYLKFFDKKLLCVVDLFLYLIFPPKSAIFDLGHLDSIHSEVCIFYRTQVYKMAIYGHMAIEPCATNIGKWGIPEKNYENVAQQCYLDHCNTLHIDWEVGSWVGGVGAQSQISKLKSSIWDLKVSLNCHILRFRVLSNFWVHFLTCWCKITRPKTNFWKSSYCQW